MICILERSCRKDGRVCLFGIYYSCYSFESIDSMLHFDIPISRIWLDVDVSDDSECPHSIPIIFCVIFLLKL